MVVISLKIVENVVMKVAVITIIVVFLDQKFYIEQD